MIHLYKKVNTRTEIFNTGCFQNIRLKWKQEQFHDTKGILSSLKDVRFIERN